MTRERTSAARPPPEVAIVGRPNVGKSTLFNRIAGRRIAIVDPTPGVTRDRLEEEVVHDGRTLRLIDTGGIGIVDEANLAADIEAQIDIAIARAALVLFVVDVREGIVPLDRRVAERLRRLERPVLLVANKADTRELENRASELFALGFGDALPVSAQEGYGRSELLDRVLEMLGADEEEGAREGAREEGEGEQEEESGSGSGSGETEEEDGVLALAVVGRRNVGKSSYVNALFGDQRVIVSPIPGTTRDAVDVRLTVQGRPLLLIDTAGLRKERRLEHPIELYSHARVRAAIRRADACLLVLDALERVSVVDKQLAEFVAAEHKPCVLVANKWDLVGGGMGLDEYATYLRQTLPMLDFAPVVGMSAKTCFNVLAPVECARGLYEQASTRVRTPELNRVVEEALRRRTPPIFHGLAPKVYYATQVGTNPVRVVLFVNNPGAFDDHYMRYLKNRLRAALPFAEVPVRVDLRRRGAKRAGAAAPDRKLARAGAGDEAEGGGARAPLAAGATLLDREVVSRALEEGREVGSLGPDEPAPRAKAAAPPPARGPRRTDRGRGRGPTRSSGAASRKARSGGAPARSQRRRGRGKGGAR